MNFCQIFNIRNSGIFKVFSLHMKTQHYADARMKRLSVSFNSMIFIKKYLF